ncbi:MAG: crossover junction endodeoxyribonuclease RuvC [Candidatus Omnitrophica bacterium]|nr:crossover junction endodeoxyribonuclease RuvC [Candidatus Omnitrophota bacterium]
MRIIGIDPALRMTGFGIIDSNKGGFSLVRAGTISTSTNKDLPSRLIQIFDAVNSLILEFKPRVMVLEKIYSHAQHPATAFVLGQARGIICLAAGKANLELVEYSATHVKKSVVGRGLASKEQVQRMVCSLLNMKTLPKYKDVTDALALAIAYSYFSKTFELNSNLK